MANILANFTTDLIVRLDGSLHFRFFVQPIVAVTIDFSSRLDDVFDLWFFVQPAVAAVVAFLDGILDASAGRTPYGWAILTDPENRRFLIRDGWKSISKVFVLAFAIDLAFQFLELREIRLIPALIVTCLLVLVPYVLLRGLVNRLTRSRETLRGLVNQLKQSREP